VAETSKLAYRTYSYVILDEAQRIKNDQSLIGQAARRLRGVRKILITGTPLQNDMHELWALLNFLLPDVFESCEMFDNAFSKKMGKTTHMDSKLVAAAHRLLQPLMIRRLKSEVQKNLPPKTVLTVWCPLTAMQKFW
jgi:SWI/SNF-related matrix-associated actin-dependent regulator of chromatin subfamily A member 5